MAIERHNTLVLTQQSPGGLACNAADIRAHAALVRAWRDRVWPSQRPSAPPLPAPAQDAPVVIPPLIESKSDVVSDLPAVPGRISVRRVLETTATHFRTTVEELVSPRRTQPLTRRRQIAAYVAHKVTGRSLVFIGRKMGGRDHTTVLHAVRTVKARIGAGNADTIAAVDAITGRLTGGANA